MNSTLFSRANILKNTKILVVIRNVENLLEQLSLHGEAGYRTNEYTQLYHMTLDIAKMPQYASKEAQISLESAASRLCMAAAYTNPKVALPRDKYTLDRIKHALSGAIIHLHTARG